MKPENKRMQDFLKSNGINAVPMYIKDGSLKGSWRLYGLSGKNPDGSPIYQKWWDNIELQDKLNNLGFTDLWGERLTNISGNGGVFSIFVIGHNELLNEPIIKPEAVAIPYVSKEARRQLRLNKATKTDIRNTERRGYSMYL